MYSSRLYAKNPVFETVYEESVKVYHLHIQANKLLKHRRGKREEGEAPVSKHQTQLGRVRWASRRGEGKPNPPRETKNSGANGGRNWRT